MTEMPDEQKQAANVRFAEAMGWAKCPRDPDECFFDASGKHRIAQFWTKVADALELAEKLELLYAGGPNGASATYSGAGEWFYDEDFCAAICLAALALLDEKEPT